MIAAIKSFYEGFWKHDKPHGRGRLILKDMTVIEGTFVNGLVIRKWTDRRGNYFDGFSNLNGQAHGKCSVRYISGECYNGDWINGRREGKGLYRPNNGPELEGEWTDDKL